MDRGGAARLRRRPLRRRRRPTQRQAAAAADEYRRARDEARDIRTRLARLERRDAAHTRAATALAAATPGDTVRAVRRSVVQTLQNAGVSGVRLSVLPAGRPMPRASA